MRISFRNSADRGNRVGKRKKIDRSEDRLPGPLVYFEAGGAREGGVTTEEAPEKRSLSAGRTHATCTGAASAAAKAPGTALMWATWQQIGQASTEPGLSTCHQAAPVARSAIPPKAITKTAKRSDRMRRGALIVEGSIIFKISPSRDSFLK